MHVIENRSRKSYYTDEKTAAPPVDKIRTTIKLRFSTCVMEFNLVKCLIVITSDLLSLPVTT